MRQVQQAERWQRDDETSRLSAEVPGLLSVKIAIEEWRDDQQISGARYTKHIVVSSAPARFELPCGDPRCQDGGHDITYEIMRTLRANRSSAEGQSECRGSLGDRTCSRVVKFVMSATFASATADEGSAR